MSASPNPNQVMSTLRMLGDQELGQYAKMHKSDPYIFPLAFQESMLRKQMRSQGAAQQQGPGGPPPPVNQQALASMQQLPESSGIARIAPPGVANMAAGGIVGFAGNEGSLVGAPIEETIMRQREEIQQGLRTDFSPEVKAAMRNRPMSLDPGVIPGATGRGNRPTTPYGPKLLGTTPPNETVGFDAERARNMAEVNAGAPAAPVAPVPEVKPGLEGLRERAGGAYPTGGAGGSMRASVSGGGAGPGTNLGPEGAAPVMPTRSPTDFSGALAKAMAGQNATTAPFAAERAELNAAADAAAKAQLEGRQGLYADQGKLYDKIDTRLNDRRGDIEKEGKRNEAMGWITAGLEMMQAKGPGLAAIASGAQKGFSQYGAGLEKLKAAQERLDEAADRVTESRLGSKKEQLAAQGEYDKALLSGKKDALADTMAHFNVSRQVATEMLKLQASEGQAFAQMSSQEKIAEATRRSQEKIAAGHDATSRYGAQLQASATRASAGRNPQLELVEALSADPKKLATYRAMHAQGGGTTREQLYNKYITDFKKDPTDPNSVMMTPQQFTAVMDRVMGSAPAITVTSAAPTAGALKRKD